MAYTIDWYIPKRVLLITYHDEITLDDLKGVNAEFSHYIAEGAAPIHLITHLQTPKYPTNLKSLRDVLTMLSHPQWGWFMIVGVEDALAQFLVHLVGKVFKLQTRVVPSIDEAHDVLKRIDISIAELEEMQKQD